MAFPLWLATFLALLKYDVAESQGRKKITVK
jgi:hypothetical protein